MSLRIEKKKKKRFFPGHKYVCLRGAKCDGECQMSPQKEKKTNVKGIRPNLLFQRIR